MPLILKPTRYAHPEGHTDVCYFTGDKGGLITCGADGDVRSWLDLMDDDPSASCIAEQATSCISKNGKIYIGNDNNTVQILTYPDLEKAGIVTRFSSTVSSLATTQNSSLIVSGGCDMRIQITNIESATTIELEGHEAPILALTLDPKEEFVASSSADGTIRIWDINEKKTINTWNVVPKGNSFFTAKCLCVPSFDPKYGKYLAYPHGNEVIITERGSWKEIWRLKSPNIKKDINICKFSECGIKIAACSVNGEIVVWNVDNWREIGNVEHQQKAKITSLVWHLERPNELAFCDSLGQLGCIDVIVADESPNNLLESAAAAVNESDVDSNDIINSDGVNNIYADNNDDDNDNDNDNNDDDDDDDDDNVISLSKLKASVLGENDGKNHFDAVSIRNDKQCLLSHVNLQESFQPGSTPVHLLSRFMVWNDVGIVKCYQSEDAEESTIEVEFHDTSIHHSMHINNYLRHTMAALSTEALALSCPSSDGEASKLVVIMLQAWGTGNKEWTIDLPEDEESMCIATGRNFVALATSKRHLRIFMLTGIQREIIAIPGPVVSMNALGNHLLVAYHSGIGISNDQRMALMWLHICGINIKGQTLSLPLSPSNQLMWLGLTDFASPTVMDADGIIRIYKKKTGLWRVAIDTDRQVKGKMDHYFIIGISESEKCIRCVLCKGSHYPATTPRPTVIEVPLNAPLCQMDSEKTKKEAPIWQIGSNPGDEDTALFTLIGYCCNSKLEHCVVDLCQHIAKQNLIELAIKYATKTDRIALAKKLQTIAETKMAENMENKKYREEEVISQDMFEDMNEEGKPEIQEEEVILTTAIGNNKKRDIFEIKPMTLSLKRNNPFLKKKSAATSNALDSLSTLPHKPEKSKSTIDLSNSKITTTLIMDKKPTFVVWYEKKKVEFKEEFPELSARDLTKLALERYKIETSDSQKSESTQDIETKKRKLSSPDLKDGEAKRPPSKLVNFAFTK